MRAAVQAEETLGDTVVNGVVAMMEAAREAGAVTAGFSAAMAMLVVARGAVAMAALLAVGTAEMVKAVARVGAREVREIEVGAKVLAREAAETAVVATEAVMPRSQT